MGKNFSTGNIYTLNSINDTNENSTNSTDNEFSFNDDINSLSSYEVEFVNSINSTNNNDNGNNQLSPQNNSDIGIILNDSSISSYENQNNETESTSSFEREKLQNRTKNVNINNIINNIDNNNSTIQNNTIIGNNNTSHNNNNNNINNVKKNNVNNEDIGNNSSLLRKNHLIPEELKEITGSYSSLLYNELTRPARSHQIDNLDNLDNLDSPPSSFSLTSISSLTSSQSPESSLETSKQSMNQINNKITSLTTSNNTLTSPLSVNVNTKSNHMMSNTENKHENEEENKKEKIKEKERVKEKEKNKKEEKEEDNSDNDNDNDNVQKLMNKSIEDEKQTKLTTINSNNDNNDDNDVLTIKELDGFRRWILCFCIVNFDLEVGQAIEYVYPPTDLTEEEKKNVSFSAFPDSNSSSHKGNSLFCFRMKSGPSTEKLYHHQHHFSPVTRMRKEDQRFNKQSLNGLNKYQKDLKIDMDGYIYGYVFFRQQKDPTNKRGYFQKSFVLLSPHPFKGLFMKIVEKLGFLYFSSLKIGKTVEDEILIQKRRKIFKMAISFINKWPNPPSILNDRYFFIRSNSIKQTPPNIVLSFPFFKSIYPIMFAPASHYPQFFNTNTNSQNMNSQDKSSKITIHQEMPVCPGRIYEIFRQSIGDAWQLWEMMILGEPILILGDTPRSCSETIYALIELIKPVPYGGDFRPYFTIQDSDFKNVIKRETTLPNIIIGTTNPVFSKALDHWPNMIYVQRKPCNNSMINNDTAGQQPIGVGKPIKKENQSIVSTIWTSLLPSSSSSKTEMSTSSSLKNFATLFPIPNLSSSSSVNNLASTSSISTTSNTSSLTNSLQPSINNINSNSNLKPSNNVNTNNTNTNSGSTSSSSKKNNNSGLSGFNWSSLLNGKSSTSSTTNPIKHSSSHDITTFATEESKSSQVNSTTNNSKRSSFFASLSLKKSNESLLSTPKASDGMTPVTSNSSSSTLHEVNSLTPAVSSGNLLKNEEDVKPPMPTSIQPSPPGKTNIECVEKIITKHKSYFHKDKMVIKKITEAALMGYSLDIINNMFRRHFVELSEKFLQPLDYYFDKEVIYNVRLMKFSDLRFLPQIENFNREAFLKIITDTSPIFPLKCKRTLIEFYRVFIKSPNFSLWFLLRICNALREWRRRYFYVMCEGDLRYWIKTGRTRFYDNNKNSNSNSNSNSNNNINSSSNNNNNNNGNINRTTNSISSSTISNQTITSPTNLKSPEILKPKRTNNTFDTSSIGHLKNKEMNIRLPKLIEIIELLLRYRDELYHYEGLFVDKNVDLTSFSSEILNKEFGIGRKNFNENEKSNRNYSSSTSSTSPPSSHHHHHPSTEFYQMRRVFSNSVDSTPNNSKMNINININKEPNANMNTNTNSNINNSKDSISSVTSSSLSQEDNIIKENGEVKESNDSQPKTFALKDTQNTNTNITNNNNNNNNNSNNNNNNNNNNGNNSHNTSTSKDKSKSDISILAEEITLQDLEEEEEEEEVEEKEKEEEINQEITTVSSSSTTKTKTKTKTKMKILNAPELIQRIFDHPEIEKFTKRKSRHRHINLPIPLSCPTPKSTRFYENISSMDDLILPTREQYDRLKQQYQVLWMAFSENVRLMIEEQLRN